MLALFRDHMSDIVRATNVCCCPDTLQAALALDNRLWAFTQSHRSTRLIIGVHRPVTTEPVLPGG